MLTFNRLRLITAGALLALLVAACSAPPPPPPPSPVKLTGTLSLSCAVGSPCTGALVGSGGVPATYVFNTTTATPPFLTFTVTGATDSFTGTPAFADYQQSPETFNINLTDGNTSITATVVVTITQPTGLSGPTISGSPSLTATSGTAYAFTPTVTDSTGTPLIFGASGLPSWLSINPNTGALTGTPGDGDVGTDSGIVISVSDGYGLSAQLASFDIVVSPAAVVPPPPITGGSGGAPTVAQVGQSYSFTPSLSDPQGNGRVWTFVAGNIPVWANFDPVTGKISGTPLYAFLGQTTSVSITATSGTQTTAPFTYNLQVTAPQPGYLPSAPAPQAEGAGGGVQLPAVGIQPAVLNGITSNGNWTLYASTSVVFGNPVQFSEEFNLVSYVANAQPTQISCGSAVGCLTLSYSTVGTPSFSMLNFAGSGSFAGTTTCIVQGGGNQPSEPTNPAEPTTLTAAVSPAAPVPTQLLMCTTGVLNPANPGQLSSTTGYAQIAYSASPYNANALDLSVIVTQLNTLQQPLQTLTLDYAVDVNGNAALIGTGQLNSNGGGGLSFLHQ